MEQPAAVFYQFLKWTRLLYNQAQETRMQATLRKKKERKLCDSKIQTKNSCVSWDEGANYCGVILVELIIKETL